MPADFVIRDEGSIVLLIPQSPAAFEWCGEHLPDDGPRLGNSYAVEPRYICPITDGIEADGLTLEVQQ